MIFAYRLNLYAYFKVSSKFGSWGHEPRRGVYKDYEVGNWYTSTSPYSSFTKRLTAARSDEHCRYTIKGQEFTRYFKGGGSEKKQVNSLEEMKQVLENDFLINLSGLTNLERLMTQ